MATEDDVTRSAQASTVADAGTEDETGMYPGASLGPYRLVREIGRGGMGTVYLAVREDDEFRKRVAIKVLKPGMDSEAIVRRFRHERQILAGLDHPYIANLLDGGTTPEGLPYFAMEYIDGQPIDRWCEARQLDTTARIELFRRVCAAVQYAHQNLIVHRDIKPGNVLVTGDGTPKLLDFGIAKLLNPELGESGSALTMAGPQMMTPEYASPEQVRGEPVSTSSDVYSLGVLLYELLTGTRPYRITSRAPSEIARVVCGSEPPRPSTAVTGTGLTQRGDDAPRASAPGPPSVATTPERLRRRLAGDLDNIILKALSKDPGRRYASVDLFSEDLRRHLTGLPVTARRDTPGYRVSKFVERNRAAVVAAGLVLLALIAGIVGTSWQARVARRERQRAEQRFDDVRALANAALFELHDAIRDLPGSTPARQLLVSRGLAYLDKLEADAGDRPDLRRELAAAYLKVGDVQGRPLNPNLGDTAGALESYRKAAAIYESLGAAEAGDDGLRRELSTALARLSEALASTGDTAAALAAARRALEIQQQVASASSGDTAVPADVRRELAAGYSRVGDLLSATGDTQGALEHRRRALGLMETLTASDPDDVSNLRQLGVAYQKLGNSLGNPNYPNVGDFPGALLQLERAADVYRRAVAVHPSNAMFRRNAAVVDSNLADVLLALKRPDEALAKQRQALAAFESLAAADPTNVAAGNDVAISLSKIAEMLDGRGRPAQAVAVYERALGIHQRMFAADPRNESLKLEVASDYNRLATSQTKLERRADALANHTRAVEISREVLAANTENVELTVAVALALAGRGDAYFHFARHPPSRATRQADLASAERDYAEAVDRLEGLARRKVIDGTDLQTLSEAKASLAKIRSERSP
ncbi:MAG TPA: serine/threonine-protein kinase [Vicinamibacterales bacterium]|nr:serine/threonine-protein kinase [Vicinamibacterales bacterium]